MWMSQTVRITTVRIVIVRIKRKTNWQCVRKSEWCKQDVKVLYWIRSVRIKYDLNKMRIVQNVRILTVQIATVRIKMNDPKKMSQTDVLKKVKGERSEGGKWDSCQNIKK